MGPARLFPLSKLSASIETGGRLTLGQGSLFDPEFYAKRTALTDYEKLDLYKHYHYVGRLLGLDPNEYFSTNWYVERYADVRALGIDPLNHYTQRGAAEGRDPSPAFSTNLYRLLYPDVAESGMNPLLHYLRHGRQEGRFAPPAALLPALDVMRDPAAVIALEPSDLDAVRPLALVMARWSARLSDAASPESASIEIAGAGVVPDDAVGGEVAKATPETAHPERAERMEAPERPRPIRHGSGRWAKPGAARVMERRSPWLVRVFAALFARDLARSFDAVRLFGRLPSPVEGPVVILTNHPSWWDAELYHWLAATAFPDRRGFAPMDAAHLAKHPILSRLGAFPVSPGSFAGATAFLATSERIVRERDTVLFVAAEGRFNDVRARPVQLMPGVGYLARRVPEATFIPLAIDYVFWRERRANLLLRFGEPIRGAALAGLSTGASANRLASGLETTMSALSEAAQSRQPQRFKTLLSRRGGAMRDMTEGSEMPPR